MNVFSELAVHTEGKMIIFTSRWLLRAWLYGKFQPSFWNKLLGNQIGDYMENDPAPAAIQPGLKILSRFEKPG